MNCIHLSACVLSHQRNRENGKTGICSSAHQLFDLYFKLDSCAGQPGKKSCQFSMWPLDRTAPGPDALYSSRHFLAESELKLQNALWKDFTIFLHSFFCLVSFM